MRIIARHPHPEENNDDTLVSEDEILSNERWALVNNLGFPAPEEGKESFYKFMNSSERRKWILECKDSWQDFFMTTNRGCTYCVYY